MTAGKVLLLRHGQTDWNVALRLQGQSDIDLNEVGREQARSVALAIAALNPGAVVASDLSRAAETAELVAAGLGLEVQLDSRLRERNFGQWEGLTGADIEVGWAAEYATWRSGQYPEGIGAETRGVVGERFARGVEDAAAELSSSETLLVVAHGACIAAGITTLLGLDADSWVGIRGIGNCHWSVLGSSDREPRWRLEGHNVSG